MNRITSTSISRRSESFQFGRIFRRKNRHAIESRASKSNYAPSAGCLGVSATAAIKQTQTMFNLPEREPYIEAHDRLPTKCRQKTKENKKTCRRNNKQSRKIDDSKFVWFRQQYKSR